MQISKQSYSNLDNLVGAILAVLNRPVDYRNIPMPRTFLKNALIVNVGVRAVATRLLTWIFYLPGRRLESSENSTYVVCRDIAIGADYVMGAESLIDANAHAGSGEVSSALCVNSGALQ